MGTLIYLDVFIQANARAISLGKLTDISLRDIHVQARIQPSCNSNRGSRTPAPNLLGIRMRLGIGNKKPSPASYAVHSKRKRQGIRNMPDMTFHIELKSN